LPRDSRVKASGASVGRNTAPQARAKQCKAMHVDSDVDSVDSDVDSVDSVDIGQ
jgi:hypothetical protein